MTTGRIRLGFFTRILDDAPPAERYRLALQQVAHAEAMGFDSAWVAQHHFHGDEGGMPAPFVFLAQAAATTSLIRLGTGIVTLPLDHPIRVAEDTSVLDLMSGGRLEVGVGPGGNLSAFAAFGLDGAERSRVFADNLHALRGAWLGHPLPGGDTLYPANPSLAGRMWQATFTVEGGRRAGAAGDGLLLSRTQPRTPDAPDATLADIQNPIVDAYLGALPPGREPRILASRSVFVADDRQDAWRYAEAGLDRMRARLPGMGLAADLPLADLLRVFDTHTGTPAEVTASLGADTTLARATDLAVQVHSVDPPHALILRSIELMAQAVAPALGWVRDTSGLRRAA